MKREYNISDIKDLDIVIWKPFLVFLKWDLWAWKTTLSKYIINDILWISEKVLSPTYTYYNKYNNIYHFDLYRLSTYDEFFYIWWEDILDNNSGVIIIEWPELIEKYYKPDLEIILTKTSNEEDRIIEVIKKI